MGKDTYETFDSGKGPVIPAKEADNFAHNDAADGDSEAMETGGELSVPTMPQKGGK